MGADFYCGETDSEGIEEVKVLNALFWYMRGTSVCSLMWNTQTSDEEKTLRYSKCWHVKMVYKYLIYKVFTCIPWSMF